jgi:hypothetical protein
MTFSPFWVFAPVVGWAAAVACVKLRELPDLSSICETAPATSVIVDVSEASTHKVGERSSGVNT